MKPNIINVSLNDKFNNFPFYFYLSNDELFNMTEEEFQNLSDYQIYTSVRDPMGEFDNIEFEYLDLLQRVKVYYNNILFTSIPISPAPNIANTSALLFITTFLI